MGSWIRRKGDNRLSLRVEDQSRTEGDRDINWVSLLVRRLSCNWFQQFFSRFGGTGVQKKGIFAPVCLKNKLHLVSVHF